jgi:hypothetical protein
MDTSTDHKQNLSGPLARGEVRELRLDEALDDRYWHKSEVPEGNDDVCS